MRERRKRGIKGEEKRGKEARETENVCIHNNVQEFGMKMGGKRRL